MTLTATPNRHSADGNGATNSFTLPFQIQSTTDVSAVLVDIATGTPTSLVYGSDFTLAGIGGANTTMVLTTAPAVGKRLIAWRDPVLDQLTSYTPGDPFPAKVHEGALDHLSMQIARLDDRVDRMPYLPDSSLGATSGVPEPIEGALLGWTGGRWQWLLAAAADLGAALLSPLVSAGDALIAVKSPWTGSALRTQHQRNTEDIRVTDGANVDPTGAIDSTAGIQAALNAASGGSITFPAGTYKISAGLTVPAGTYIYGYGATLQATAHFTMMTFADGGGVFGMEFIGAGNATYNAAGNGVKCVGVNNAPSAPTYVTGPIVRDCVFRLLGSYGCYFQYCQTPTVESCYMNNIGYCGIDAESCNNQQFNKNRIDTVTPGTSGNAYGIGSGRLINASTFGNLTAEPRCKGGSVTGNYIANIPIWEALDTHAGDGIVFANNYVTNCLIGCALVPTHYGAADDYAPINCVIEGNTFDCFYGNCAINMSGAYNGSLVNAATGNRIVNNRTNGGGIAGDNTYGAVRLLGTRDLVVEGNQIENAKVFGIILNQDNDNFTITGNTFVDPHDASVTIPSGIGVRGINNTGYIGGNSTVKRNGAIATYVSVYSIYFSSGLTGLDVSVGKSSTVGMGVGPAIANGGGTGIDLSGCYSEVGSSSVTLASGSTSALVDVTFAGTFPVTPRVIPVCTGSPLTGGTGTIFRVTNITATGFRAIAYSATGGNYTASGSLAFDWTAQI